jgi:cystathionine beta-lyase/cystathionine gamma-synthase
VTPDDHPRPRGFATRALRAASQVPPVDQHPTAVPIYQSATFSTDDADELAAVLGGRRPGFAYSRIDNPTIAALDAAVAELEGAEAGFSLATGMAAIHATLISLARAADRILAPLAVYGSTRSLLVNVLAPLGVQIDFVDTTNLAAVDTALGAAPTRVLYAETISNPTILVADHVALARLAHRHGATYVVDNTFASPYVCRPLDRGADLVVESATKYLGGHSDVLAGVVAGRKDLVDAIRRVQVDTGATLSPFAAFLVLRGIQTLAVRLDRQSATALALASWLEGQAGVLRVSYPGLPSHPAHEIAARQFRIGGGMFAVELEGDRRVGPVFIDALSVPEMTASLGSVRTMVVHPSTTTHRQLDDAALAEAGIAPGLLRCSIGLEDLEDLLDDLERGLAAARRHVSEQIAASLSTSPAPPVISR